MKPGVRITGGDFKGRGLAVPPGARPTEGRVREALFSMWGESVDGARVLDLFAGSGVVGLEAIGRGALSVLAVDQDRRTIETLEANAALLGEEIGIRRLTLPAGLSRLAEERVGPFDLVFADPPYVFNAYPEILAGVIPLLSGAGEVCIKHSSRRELPVEVSPLVKVETRRYGESSLSFYRLGPV
ncbi:MAG TPA: 16S rRNA (guanine(966)-N(2))-methyltransferase RsmD [Thermoanaerobaculia bacterium]|nr:16S rRNA (guanine(966)-N(2))-methyltransferase RsmD [Thermoanaerobaculia bacterium]